MKRVAILGGTGKLGSGLASRLSKKAAAYEVILGSRDLDHGRPYREAVAEADIVILAVPFAHHADILNDLRDSLANKILVDATVPLVPPKVARVQLPPEGSAALAAQQILGEEVTIVSAFQNVSAELLREEGPIDCDVLVSGDDPDARSAVIALTEAMGLRGLHAGPLANSAAAEALTSVLIFLNRRHGGHSGIHITGLEA